MTTALTNGRILTEDGWLQGHAVLVDGADIAAIVPAEDVPAGADMVDLQGSNLLPGFIDVQVNGGGGVLFNDEPTVGGIRAIASAHAAYGTTGLLPTLISDDLAVVERAMRAVEAAIEAGVPGVLGIHIEGPFLNTDKKGIHNPEKFRAIDEDAFRLLTSLQNGVTHVTIAPEKTTPDMVRRLADAGVVISAGHTNATYEETEAALASGLRGFTHLYNAMSPLNSRAPGVVGAAMADEHAFAGIIVDGHHVHAGALKVALRAMGPGRLMLVTDAMPSVGMKDKSFLLQGMPIAVVDGKCTGPDGTLAGSDLDMAGAVRNTVAMLDVSLETAAHMASQSPARFLKLQDRLGGIAVGKRASLVLVDKDINVRRVWIDGAEQAI
ncbi:MAG: N-acetylglucosamine-6-phosphate deacetylase [Alphaproteobacteria bacterium]|nr:MAG: N-acetylglucosamine-6-phosphate deacetylase [Alphaproteobacteria bacterium]